MKNKICAVLAVIFLLSYIGALPLFAVEDDGTNIDLESQGYVGITTEKELKTTTKDFYLKNDIVFTEGIGNSRSDIRIHGNGHTVYFEGGLSIIESGANITVQDLKLEGKVNIGEDTFSEKFPLHYGPLVTKVTGGSLSLSDITATMDIMITDSGFSGCIGGLIGRSVATAVNYNNVAYKGSINTGKSVMSGYGYSPVSVGGIAGTEGYAVTIKDVNVVADIVVGNELISGVGGLFGKLENVSDAIYDCYFTGSISVDGRVQSNCGIGGIVGVLSQFVNLNNVANDGNIFVSGEASNASVGGVIGVLTPVGSNEKFERVLNTGNLSGAHIAGGIVGNMLDERLANLSIFNVKNEGTVIAESIAGGIIGRHSTENALTISNAYNKGAISVVNADAEGAGGIIGFSDCTEKLQKIVSMHSAYNSGNITGNNATPLADLNGYSDESVNTEGLFYSNDILGSSIGKKTTDEDIKIKVQDINFLNVSFSAFSTLYNRFEALEPSHYTTDSWARAEAAVAEGDRLYNAAVKRQWQVDDVIDELQDALDSLEELSLSPDEREAFDALLKECSSLKESNYSPRSWWSFGMAFNAALNAKTDMQKRDAYKPLYDAKEALVSIAPLRDAIQKLPEQEECKTNEEWRLVFDTRKSAMDVLNKEDPTQAEVDDATAQVLNVLSSLDIDNSDSTSASGTESNWDDLWNDFMSQQSESLPSDLAGLGNNNKNSIDCGVTLGVVGVVLFAILAVGVGIVFRNNDD